MRFLTPNWIDFKVIPLVIQLKGDGNNQDAEERQRRGAGEEVESFEGKMGHVIAVVMLFIINNNFSGSSIRVYFLKYFILGGATRVHGRSRRYEGTALYACLCGLEPIQSPECRAADTIPTPPYTHPYMHPYILTIRYKALPPKSPYTVPYAGFGWLISKFQVLRHIRIPT
jgi:hypothetical protein